MPKTRRRRKIRAWRWYSFHKSEIPRMNEYVLLLKLQNRETDIVQWYGQGFEYYDLWHPLAMLPEGEL